MMTSGLFLSASDVLALITFTVVYADHAIASRTFIFLRLLAQKLVDTVISYELEVIDHAHVISGTIPLVERLQILAREIGAFIAETNLIVNQQVAMLFYEGALLIARQTSRAVYDLAPFLFQIIGISKITAAEAAVHAARSD